MREIEASVYASPVKGSLTSSGDRGVPRLIRAGGGSGMVYGLYGSV